ncbi:hypothetical protein TOPH_01547 [Tolypocladium ophioglossoides CBS 100239]|uniref:Uncharacterized protein n=1 Tax=Tolypocladium ophioglossoides (strain CBS 100239) TaxID=1163406 RepID=A0A0L0NIP2_TOLOC|nr:hypothetical protein TOPH_01547 [Tolypocladium ophioglossoides CBS 100239]
MAPVPVHDGRDRKLEAGLLSTMEEEKTAFIPAGPQKSQPKRNMSPIRRLAVGIIVGLFVGLGLAVAKDSATARCLGAGHGVSDNEVKAALAKDPSPDLLHRLLHAYLPDRYQHGVYKSDNDAVKAVHDDEPGLATTLAGLAKRQSGSSGSNTTSAGGVTVTQSTTPTTSSEVKPSDPTTSEFSAATIRPVTPVSRERPTDHNHRPVNANHQRRASDHHHHYQHPDSTYHVPGPFHHVDLINFSATIDYPYLSDKQGAVNHFPVISLFLCHLARRLLPLPVLQCPPLLPLFFLLFVVLFRSGNIFHDNIPATVDVDIADFRYVGCSSCLLQSTEDRGTYRGRPGAIFHREEPAGFPARETTPTSTPTSTQETITTGKVTTSSAVRKTLTTTLGNGGTTTITSTSWVAVVPSPTTSGSSNPDLQNAASQKRRDVVLAVAAGALVAGVLLA